MLARIKAILRERGYILYTKPYQLNIVGLRGKSTVPNKFNDEIHVFYRTDAGNWNYHVFNATTDPGTFWLNNPLYEQGTAILATGQYVDAYALGMHRGLYEALVQVKPVTIIRDYNRDSVLDFNNGVRQTGFFGINVHRAESSGTTQAINKYSAGCQVFQTADDFATFIAVSKLHIDRHGNLITYSLIDFRAINRITLKRVVQTTTVAVIFTLSWILRKFYSIN
ncbi:hypothetical protein [Parachryseolinea silvisoli]|uniref:hypothetical protein n=1 Tax=Parachryseolinea silvisoli TaxID=2873601 RepID=UPI002265D360|nr:hypothetical protein [Parachryseolinea silvisoli]MCD9019142.1 hypothetical protein [Parachryseolinea silvisoli]